MNRVCSSLFYISFYVCWLVGLEINYKGVGVSSVFVSLNIFFIRALLILKYGCNINSYFTYGQIFILKGSVDGSKSLKSMPRTFNTLLKYYFNQKFNLMIRVLGFISVEGARNTFSIIIKILKSILL